MRRSKLDNLGGGTCSDVLAFLHNYLLLKSIIFMVCEQKTLICASNYLVCYATVTIFLSLYRFVAIAINTFNTRAATSITDSSLPMQATHVEYTSLLHTEIYVTYFYMLKFSYLPSNVFAKFVLLNVFIKPYVALNIYHSFFLVLCVCLSDRRRTIL